MEPPPPKFEQEAAQSGVPTKGNKYRIFLNPEHRGNCRRVYTPNTRNSEPGARNPEPEIRNPEPETRNPKSETRNPKHGT